MLDKQKKTILVIDNYKDNLMFMKLSLENKGYYVRLANSTNSGLLEIYQDCPDLLILDLAMPITSSFKVIERLKANSIFSQIPIILLTANVDFSKKYSVGVEVVLYKPVDINYLLRQVKLLLLAKENFKLRYGESKKD